LAKYTSVLLFPLAIALWLLVRVGNRSLERTTLISAAAQWATVLLLALCVYTFRSQSMQELAQRLDSRLPVPLPRDYVEGLDLQRHVMEQKHPVYLDGHWSDTGFAGYYLWAMWYKLPHALQLLVLLAALFVLVPGGEPRMWRIQLALLLPAAALVWIAAGSAMQLGIRYLLPMIPFLILFAGQTGRWLNWRQYRMRAVAVALLGAGALLSVRHHPHHLAYFNELAGGPANGHRHLLDSNIDWGQDLRALAAYIDEQEIDDIGLAYFGTVTPSSCGIRWHLPPRDRLEPGWYAVSTNFLEGYPRPIRTPEGSTYSPKPGEFSYFKSFEPVARIGYSIWVYHIPETPTRASGTARLP
jgi:hypothetical protein